MLEHLRAESVVTIEGEVVSRGPEATNPNLPTGAIEVVADEVDRPVGRRGAAAAGRGRGRLSRGYPPSLPLSRPSARAAPRQHRAAQPGDQLDPPADDRGRLHRVPDADPDRLQPRRRARLSGAEPGPSRQVLRAPAGAADVQAADHGRRLRPLFPDRALLPRRGRPRRPLARRILPARFRNELRHAGRCFRSDRAGARRRVRGIRRRQERDARPASSRASPTRRRCSNTAPTSPICATRS